MVRVRVRVRVRFKVRFKVVLRNVVVVKHENQRWKECRSIIVLSLFVLFCFHGIF